MWGHIRIRVRACVPSSDITRTTRNLRYKYGAPLWTIFGDELSECRCDASAFDLRRLMCRPSKIDVSTFEDRCVDFRRWVCRPSKIDVSTFKDRWSMCRPSNIDDRCVDLRGSTIGVSTFEDGWSMCQPSMIDVKLCCYTCSKH